MLNKKALEAATNKMIHNEFKVVANKESDFERLAEVVIIEYLNALSKNDSK